LFAKAQRIVSANGSRPTVIQTRWRLKLESSRPELFFAFTQNPVTSHFAL